MIPIRDSKDIFYCNFQVGIKVHIVGYGDINFCNTKTSKGQG